MTASPRLAALALVSIALPALGAAPPTVDEKPLPPHEAGPSDAPARAAAPKPRGPAGRIAFGGVVHVQANVDAAGMNVIGDAGNEPSIAIDPTAPNRLAAGWRQFDDVSSNFRQAGYAYSRDGGRTWSAQQKIEPGIFRSDPVLGAAPDGTFYYLSLEVINGNEFYCDMFVSGDHGATWPAKHFAYGGDKAWFAIDTSDGPGSGNVYQPWNVAGNTYFPNQFNRSVGGATAWEDPVTYDPDGDPPARPVFGILDVGPDGSVYVAGARNSQNSDTFWVVKSIDAQSAAIPTFSQHVQVNMGGNLRLSTGPNPAGLLGQVEIKVDKSGGPRDGWVYVLCSVDPPGDDPMDVRFIRSEDGGLTWSVPKRVNDDPLFSSPSWQWFGTMGLAPSGRLDAVWNDTREFPAQDNLSHLRYASSSDGGVTWTPSVQISPTWDSHIGWPNQNKIGDYYELVSDDVGTTLIWSATFNGEQDVYVARIGDHDCNRNGIGDAEDLASGAAADCNDNGIPDSCEIAAGELADANGDGIPDDCACFGDLDGDGNVGFSDLVAMLGAWGPCVGCPADLDGNDDVGFTDLTALLAAWGPCAK